MGVLVLHLTAPLQSWGASGRFNLRDTFSVPTKSAVCGLLAACEGRPRGADVSDLAALKMAARVDRPGIAVRDYHTVGAKGRSGARLRNASGGRRYDAIVTDRWYLAGAGFTVVLGGDSDVVGRCYQAVLGPRFAPFLGRRCCPPDAGWVSGVLPGADPYHALTEAVPLVSPVRASAVRVLTDDPGGSPAAVSDMPLGTLNRAYGIRMVSDEVVNLEHLPRVDDAIELWEVISGGVL